MNYRRGREEGKLARGEEGYYVRTSDIYIWRSSDLNVVRRDENEDLFSLLSRTIRLLERKKKKKKDSSHSRESAKEIGERIAKNFLPANSAK